MKRIAETQIVEDGNVDGLDGKVGLTLDRQMDGGGSGRESVSMQIDLFGLVILANLKIFIDQMADKKGRCVT